LGGDRGAVGYAIKRRCDIAYPMNEILTRGTSVAAGELKTCTTISDYKVNKFPFS